MSRKKLLSLELVFTLVLALFVAAGAFAVGDYTYINGYPTAAMSVVPDGNNGRGFGVNANSSSPYYGYIYYCNHELSATTGGSDSIEIMKPDGTTIATIPVPNNNNLIHDCAVDPVDDTVYVASLKDRQIFKMAPDGSSIKAVITNTGLTGDTDFSRGPRSIYVTGSGSNRTLYVAACTENQVWTSSDNGNTWTKQKVIRTASTTSQMSIGPDKDGNIFTLDKAVRDTPLNALGKYDANGNYQGVQWDVPDLTAFASGWYISNIQYVNNDLGEFLLAAATNGSAGKGLTRVYRYRMDGSIADAFGNGISADANLNALNCCDNNGLAYMKVDGHYLYLEAAVTADGKPQIMKIEMPALPAGGHPTTTVQGPLLSSYNNVTASSLSNEQDPNWAPSTSNDILYFATYKNHYLHNTNYDIFSANSDGSNWQQITPPASLDSQWGNTIANVDDDEPCSSPDGRYVIFRKYYARNSAGTADVRTSLWIMDTTTRTESRYIADGTATTGHNSYPCWVPNSGNDPSTAKVVFISGRTGKFQVYMITGPESTTNVPTKLTSDTANDIQDCSIPRSNYDGSKIVFRGKNSKNCWDIYLIDVASDTVTKLTNSFAYGSGKYAENPTFTADGTKIVFAANYSRDGNYHLYSMNLDGSNMRLISGFTGQKTGVIGKEATPVVNPNNKLACVVLNPDANTFAGSTSYGDIGVMDLTNDTTNGSITGTVYGDRNEPLAGVSVYAGSGDTVVTDANGNYTLSNVAPGGYVLSFIKNGYPAAIHSITVFPGKAATENATLEAFDAAAPSGVSAIITDKGDGTKQVSIRWQSVTTPFIQGYNVYYSSSENGPWAKLNNDLVPETLSNPKPIEYLHTPDNILSAYYRITAVANSPEFGLLESPAIYAVQAGNNLIYNGSFENTGKNGIPDGWTVVYGTSSYSMDYSNAVTGKSSIRMYLPTTTDYAGFTQQLWASVPAEGGSQYIYTFLSKAENTTYAKVRCNYDTMPAWNTPPTSDTYDPTVAITSGVTWCGTLGPDSSYWKSVGFTPKSVPLTVPDTASFWRSRPIVYNGNFAKQNAWFDEIRLSKFRLGTTGNIFGRITDAKGNAVSGATIEISGMDTKTSYADGYYYVRNVPNGNVDIKVTSSDGTITVTKSVLNAGGALVPVTLALAPGTISGTVTFSKDGSPVSGAKVTTDSGNSAISGTDGKYTIASAPGGDTKIRAWVQGYKPSPVSTVTVPAGGSATADLVISNSADSDSVKSFTIKWVGTTAPTIDGTVDPTSEWSASDTIGPFYENGGTTAAERGTTVRALYDQSKLYVSYVCTESDFTGVTTTATGHDYSGKDGQGNAINLFSFDNVALYMDPQALQNGPDGTKPTYLLACNAPADPTKTAYSDLDLDGNGTADNSWNPAGITVQAKQDTIDNLWGAEMAIPFASIPGYTGTPDPGTISGMLFARYRNENDHFLDASADTYTSTAYTTDDMTKTTFLYNATEWNNVVYGPTPQPGDVSGVVSFSKDSSAVAGAVVITNTGLSAIADANGSYIFKNVPAGPISIMASVKGWKPSTPQAINVNGNQTANITITNNVTTDSVPVLNINWTSAVPTIDGDIDSTEWAASDKFTNFYDNDSTMTTLTSVPVTAQAMYDSSNLYVAFNVTEPGTIVAATTGHDPTGFWSDDSAEFFWDPMHTHNGPAGTLSNYQLGVNANNGYYDQKVSGQANDWGTAFDIAGLVAASKTITGGYTIEMKLPFAGITELGAAPASGSLEGMLFCRGRSASPSTSQTSYVNGYWKTAANWNDVVFAAAPVLTETFATTGGFVQPGKWNLISLPGVPSNTDPTSVFAGIDVANASFQYWDNQAATPGFVGYGLGWTGPAACAVPYWMVEPKATAAKDISFEGTANKTDQVISIPAHASAPYWIAIGLPFNSADYALSNVQFSSNGGAYMSWSDAYNANPRIVDSSMQGYDAATGTFDRVNGLGADTIQPWWGYWMLVFDGNKLDIKFPVPAK